MTPDEQKMMNSLLSFMQQTFEMREAQKDYWSNGRTGRKLGVAKEKEEALDRRIATALHNGLIKPATQTTQQNLFKP